MAEFSVYVKCYDDLDLLKGLVASIPDDVTVFVVDGRYADFEGDTLRTEGAAEWCAGRGQVIYTTPPDDRLPWGHENVEAEPRLRWPIHEQAKWANYEALPQDEWILHMDADERLMHIDRSIFDRIRDNWKYAPFIDSLEERGLFVPRLYKPRYWTFWIAGVMYPREYWPRDTPLEKLRQLHLDSGSPQSINRGLLYDEDGAAIAIENVGDERPPEYHERRAKQLATMGRVERAQTYMEMVEESDPD